MRDITPADYAGPLATMLLCSVDMCPAPVSSTDVLRLVIEQLTAALAARDAAAADRAARAAE